jgi:protein TonB
VRKLVFCLAIIFTACTHRQEKPLSQIDSMLDTDSLKLLADLTNLPPPPPVDLNEPPPPPPPPPPPVPHLEDSFLIEIPKMQEFFKTDSDFKAEWVWKKAYIDSLEQDYNSPFVAVDEMPEFPGWMSELNKYLFSNLRIPKGCFGENMQHVKTGIRFDFLVDETGTAKFVEMSKFCVDSIDDQKIANRIFGNMPRWKPARRNGKPIAIKYSIPIGCILLQTE